MSFKAKYIPYRDTGAFSKIVTDYLDNASALRPFYSELPDPAGIETTIERRKAFSTDRNVLVSQLREQYKNVKTSNMVSSNIEKLSNENTFTICTAHQPNIFTGHLYFIYKIMHAIKLADELKLQLPQNDFVPVYYMGSEDADLQELGEVVINGKKYTWATKQKGAVGRMKIDKAFLTLIEEIGGQLSVERYGNDILALVKKAYTFDKTIENATFEFVNELFQQYGLVVLLPDNVNLKKQFTAINKKEIFEQFSRTLVTDTIDAFPPEYKVQAEGRDINLFYLKDDIRERIEHTPNGFVVANTTITFSSEDLMHELEMHPERFSPNVILRPVYQELILPNIAFIGGGGELAYWLELKKVFENLEVPFPVLILRNSFLITRKKIVEKLHALQLDVTTFFKPVKDIVELIVKHRTSLPLQLNGEKGTLAELYDKISIPATAVDVTLEQHVKALKTQALKRLDTLEKKMLSAEKKKFEAEQRQVQKIKEALFPGGTLQERVDNLLPYYAIFGKAFLQAIYEHSTGLRQEFCLLEEQ